MSMKSKEYEYKYLGFPIISVVIAIASAKRNLWYPEGKCFWLIPSYFRAFMYLQIIGI